MYFSQNIEEPDFSALVFLKNKYRNRLQIKLDLIFHYELKKTYIITAIVNVRSHDIMSIFTHFYSDISGKSRS